MSFSFSFSGDDIEDQDLDTQDNQRDHSTTDPVTTTSHLHAAETGSLLRRSVSNTSFPVANQPLLPPQFHSLSSLLDTLPSKISYSTLSVKLDDGSEIQIPRRELWDVRVQLMAEEDDEGLGNLGKDDVKTGVYEGGFKSWESAVDLVRVLHARSDTIDQSSSRKVLELGCGTALPSLAVFQWLFQVGGKGGLDLGLADYNPSVLRLVTLPNLLLSWALATSSSPWEAEADLEITPELISSFRRSLKSQNITLSFFSGAWSPEFIDLISKTLSGRNSNLTIIGAETIYSPAALKSFAETLLGLMEKLSDDRKTALVAAKKVYFGVGGSMEDFVALIRENGRDVRQVREESDGVRRVTVEVLEQRP